MRAPLIAGVLMLACVPAYAHSWYDYACCSDNDCRAISPNDVVTSRGGYIVSFAGREFRVPYDDSRIKPSHDKDYHACEFPKGELRCLYVPAGGV